MLARRRRAATANRAKLWLASQSAGAAMPNRRNDTQPLTPGPNGQFPTQSVPAISDIGENSASEIIEAPQKPGRDKLDPHDFADGGGGGGAEAFSRKKTRK
jgi:hypothetical protein